MSDVILGLEVIKLGDIDDGSPYRMTVDMWDSREQTIMRYQMVSKAYDKRERALEELARVQVGPYKDEIAHKLDELDREAAKKIEPIIRQLQYDQIRIIHGDEIAKMLEDEIIGE